MRSIRNTSRFTVLVLILMIFAFGCKSKKKAMEASSAEKERVKTEQEAALRKQEDETRKREEEERLRSEEAARQQQQDEASERTPTTKLNEYFSAISSSSNVASANSNINEALTLFASPETPVLIVISGSGDQKDYDRPTTIKEYLNYLKDQKKNINVISDLKVNTAGKITEVELRKN
jgi:hypothetical protein